MPRRKEAKGMAEGERATGTPNTIYDLSSVLFHALEGGASYDQFIQDAEREGDQELVEFFRMVRDEDSNRADRAQELLAERTTIGGVGMGGAAMPMEGAESGVPRAEPPGVAPGMEETRPMTEGAPPTRVGETPPRAGEAPRMRGEHPLGTEGAPLSEEEERARRPEGEREEDKGLIDRAIDRLSGEREQRRDR
jgi:hypothetical protein